MELGLLNPLKPASGVVLKYLGGNSCPPFSSSTNREKKNSKTPDAPAVLSAAVMAFLSSFENYNTTTFAILSDKTLTTVLAGRVRQGSTPAISALAVTIIAITVAGTIVYELVKRREDARKAAERRTAQDAEQRELAAA